MFRPLKEKYRRRGSFLLEALLAVSILSVSLTLVIQSLLSTFRATVYSKDYSVAQILLDNKIQEFKQKGIVENNWDEDGRFPEPYEKYSYHIESTSAADGEKLKTVSEVIFNIFWVSGKNQKNITVSTYFFNTLDE
ncbi:MAG: hypothetical protein WC676_01190 [Candidatus Omnitrophota bacterium]